MHASMLDVLHACLAVARDAALSFVFEKRRDG